MADMRDDCGACRARLKDPNRELLSDADRRQVAAHMAACDGCRREATAADPALLFMALSGGVLPEQFWDGFDRSLRARIEAETARPAPARLAARLATWVAGAREAIAWAPSPAIWAAPAVMVLVLGVTVGVLRHDMFMPGPRSPRVEALRPPYAPPGGTIRPGAALNVPARTPGGRESGVPLPALLSGAGDPPTLEEVASPSARVYRFDATDSGAEPIYFVVDESIEF
jgi:hypothetical protein